MRNAFKIILALILSPVMGIAQQQAPDSTVVQPVLSAVKDSIKADTLKIDSIQIPSRIPVLYNTMPVPSRVPVIDIPKSRVLELKNGLKILHVEDHSMPLVTFYLGISTEKVFEGDKKGLSDLTAQMLMAGVQNRTKTQIIDSLSNMGSQHRITGNSFYVTGLKKYAYANFALFADVILRPSFPLQEFLPAQNTIKENLALSETNSQVIINRVYRALAFGSKNPIGEFATVETFSKISLNNCVDFYQTYWRPNNAVMLVMGDISSSELTALVNSRFGSWEKKEPPKNNVAVSNDLTHLAVNFINDIYAQKNRIIISNLAEFDYNSSDVYPAMFINYIMGGDLLANIRKVLSPERKNTITDVFSLSPDPVTGYMYLSTIADNENVVKVIKEKTTQLEDIRTNPIDSTRLSGIKQHLIGRMALSMDDKNGMAAYSIAVENGIVKKEFIQQILRKIEKVTADDIMRVAQKYIKPSQYRIVIYGNARKVVPPLELAGYNVLFYNSTAQKVSRPSLASAVPADIKPMDVLSHYLSAMGGIRNLRSVSTLRQVFDVEIANQTFQAEILARTPYYYQEIISYKNSVYLKKTFNGNMGYTKVERTRKDLSATEVENGLLSRSIFPLVDHDKKGFAVELDSIVPVRGLFTYKLRVTLPNKQIQNYYMSIETGMPLRIENVSQAELREVDDKGKLKKYVPEKISSYTDYIEYTTIDGVKYPSLMKIKDDSGEITWTAKKTEPGVSITTKDFR